MPELPEVQTVVNDLIDAGLVGRTITAVKIYWPRSISNLSPGAFIRQINGRTIDSVWRRAKFIVFAFRQGGYLLLHLRMTGRLHLVSAGTEPVKHEHVVFRMNDQRELRFHDTRKFGRFYLVEDIDTVLGHLGPEPLDSKFTARVLAGRLRQRRRLLKPLLLDQTFLAGLGNIYVDEALWDAKIHPCRLASTLSADEIRHLHRSIRKVLRKGLKNLGTTLGTGKANFYSVGQRRGRNRDQLNVFRRTDLPCPRCRHPIERIVVGQRSTHICSVCQPVSPK